MSPQVQPPTHESTYGSDKAGLVCGYVFEPGEAGRAITSDEAAEALASAGPRHEFLWLHFSLTNTASKTWLGQHVALPSAFYDLPADRSSTRIEVVDDALVGVLNDVQFFAPEASSASTVALHVSRRLLVSARTTQLRAIDRLRTSVKSGETFRSPAELLAHLLRDQADVLVDIVRDATRQIDAAEDQIITLKTTSRSRLGALRRLLVRLQRVLAPEPAALFRLLNRPPSWLEEADLADLRQSAEELSAAVADSAAVVERIRLLQEESTALINEETNRTLFILTVVTVLALPATILSGLWGMNVGGIPFGESPGGFWAVLLIIAAIVSLGAYLARSRYRSR
jgi:zinc transporter